MDLREQSQRDEAEAKRELAGRGKGERVKRYPVAPKDGQALVEYGLIIFLVAIVVIAVLVLIGPRIDQILSSIAAAI